MVPLKFLVVWCGFFLLNDMAKSFLDFAASLVSPDGLFSPLIAPKFVHLLKESKVFHLGQLVQMSTFKILK